jgi:hypothetical protein
MLNNRFLSNSVNINLDPIFPKINLTNLISSFDNFNGQAIITGNDAILIDFGMININIKLILFAGD